MSEPLLKVENLKQYFPISRSYTVKAVNGVSFNIYPGETYGLVGESGSGKTTIGRSIIRLYNPTGGKVTFNGRDISGKMDNATRDMLRKDMQMIFQDPMASLNPRKKVADIIGEGLDIHKRYASRQDRADQISEMLKKVGLSPEHAARYPHQFSGGQRQRVGIARALIMQPQLVIADECISALDVSIQAQVVNLMKDIQEETGCAYLFIAHDLSMVKRWKNGGSPLPTITPPAALTTPRVRSTPSAAPTPCWRPTQNLTPGQGHQSNRKNCEVHEYVYQRLHVWLRWQERRLPHAGSGAVHGANGGAGGRLGRPGVYRFAGFLLLHPDSARLPLYRDG